MQYDAGDLQSVAYDGENGYQQDERCHSALPMMGGGPMHGKADAQKSKFKLGDHLC